MAALDQTRTTMTRLQYRGRNALRLPCLLLTIAASACGDTDQTMVTMGLAPAPSPEAEQPGAAPSPPLYAFANEIYGADDSTTYVNVLGSLDIAELDHSRGMEFGGGRATIATHGGKLFVAPPTSSVVQRFDVSDDGSMVLDGEMSFMGFGVSEVTIDSWSNTFVSAEKAYLFNSADGNTIVWNPVTMEIVGEVDPGPHDLVREGWSLDGSPGEVRGDRLYRTITWANWDAWQWSEERYLAVYDITTDRRVDLVSDARCPALGNRVSRDAAGTLYFSNWIWNVGQTLVSAGPTSCVLRVLPGEDSFDPSWSLRYQDIADGREGAMFAHLGGSEALVSIFHHEQVTIDAESVPSEVPATPNWRMWHVDLETRAAAPLDGLDWNTGAISTYALDGRRTRAPEP